MRSRKRAIPSKSVPAPARSLDWWHVAAGGLAALGAAFLVYGPALNGAFVFDDQYLPFFSKDYAQQPLSLAIKGVRPFLYFSFWLNSKMAGTQPYVYHVFNLLFHVISSLLVFLIARKLLVWAGEAGSRREGLAAFAGALFLLHPAQTEAVAYVASRSECLSGLFFLAALALFLYRRSTAVSWPLSAGILVLYAAAASTKEHTVALPALLLLTDCFWNPGFSFQGVRRNWRLYGPILAGGAAATVFVLDVLRGSLSAGFGVKEFTWYQYFYTQWRALWVYFRLFVLPVGQNLDYAFPVSRTPFERGAIFGLAGLLILLGLAVFYRRRYPLAAYGVLAALLMFAPTSSVVPIQDAVAERRLYLPMLGLALVAGEFLRRWKARRTVVAGALTTVLAVLALLCYQRNQVWGSDLALWEDSVAKSPWNSRAHFQLGVVYYQMGRCDSAASQYAEAARLGRKDHRLLVDAALADDCLNRSEQALEKLRQAVVMTRDADAYAMLGMVYGKQGKYAESLAALDKALSRDPRFDMAYFYRGNVHSAMGDLGRAAEDYRRALDTNPENELARRALARVTSPPRSR